MESEFLIGAVAKATGVKAETIRYYEKAGLLHPPPRGDNRYRYYSRDDVGRLKFIRKCRELGFSLEETSSLLALADNKRRTCKQVSRVAEARLNDVRAKINDLRRIEAVLEQFVTVCPNDVSSKCPILETLWD